MRARTPPTAGYAAEREGWERDAEEERENSDETSLKREPAEECAGDERSTDRFATRSIRLYRASLHPRRGAQQRIPAYRGSESDGVATRTRGVAGRGVAGTAAKIVSAKLKIHSCSLLTNTSHIVANIHICSRRTCLFATNHDKYLNH